MMACFDLKIISYPYILTLTWDYFVFRLICTTCGHIECVGLNRIIGKYIISHNVNISQILWIDNLNYILPLSVYQLQI